MNEDELTMKFLSLKNAEYIEKRGVQNVNGQTDLIQFPVIPQGSMQKHAFIYMRCSTREQKEYGHSMETQKNQLMKYCEAHNIVVVAKFEDAGISGSETHNRPGLKNMIASIQPGICVIAVSVSRLSRNTVQLLNLVQLLKQKKADVILLDLGMDTSTPLGNVMLTMLATLAEFEREQVRQRTSTSLTLLHEQNKLSHKPPFGFKRINGELIEKPEEQLVIQMIKLLVTNNPNITINNLTNQLNKKGFTNRKNKPFHATTVLSIVNNPNNNIIVKLNNNQRELKKKKQYEESDEETNEYDEPEGNDLYNITTNLSPHVKLPPPINNSNLPPNNSNLPPPNNSNLPPPIDSNLPPPINTTESQYQYQSYQYQPYQNQPYQQFPMNNQYQAYNNQYQAYNNPYQYKPANNYTYN